MIRINYISDVLAQNPFPSPPAGAIFLYRKTDGYWYEKDENGTVNRISPDGPFRGKYTTLAALQTAIPTGRDGDYAIVDAGAGATAAEYIWDAETGWVLSQGGVITSTDSITEGNTNLYFTEARVRATVLTGLSTAISRTLLAATDSILTAYGKINKYLTDLKTVAFTGSYNDLTNKPTIPAAQVQTDYEQQTSGSIDFIKNKHYYRELNKTTSFTHAIAKDVILDRIFVQKQGSTPLLRIGKTANGQEYLDETTITDYADLTIKEKFAAAGTVYFTLSGGTVSAEIWKHKVTDVYLPDYTEYVEITTLGSAVGNKITMFVETTSPEAFEIDFGDGQKQQGSGYLEITHNYSVSSSKTVRISGKLKGIGFLENDRITSFNNQANVLAFDISYANELNSFNSKSTPSLIDLTLSNIKNTITTFDLTLFPNVNNLVITESYVNSLSYNLSELPLFLELAQNRLTETFMNEILVDLDTSGATNGYINLSAQYSLQQATDLEAISNLESKGWSVSY